MANIDQQTIVWDLPLRRRGLADLALDWPGPPAPDRLPGPDREADHQPLRIEVDLEP